MKTIHGMELTENEQTSLEDAVNPNASPRRTRGLLLSALVVVVGVVCFTYYGASIVFLAGLTLATLAVSTVEKFLYQRHMEAYESLIRKLLDHAAGAMRDAELQRGTTEGGVLRPSGFREPRSKSADSETQDRARAAHRA